MACLRCRHKPDRIDGAMPRVRTFCHFMSGNVASHRSTWQIPETMGQQQQAPGRAVRRSPRQLPEAHWRTAGVLRHSGLPGPIKAPNRRLVTVFRGTSECNLLTDVLTAPDTRCAPPPRPPPPLPPEAAGARPGAGTWGTSPCPREWRRGMRCQCPLGGGGGQRCSEQRSREAMRSWKGREGGGLRFGPY